MNGDNGKKVQFKIYLDPMVLERIQMLDEILNKHHRRRRTNVTKSVYWEGVIKEHLNSRDVLSLLSFNSEKVRKEGYVE